jgi:hypothetical protein
MNRLSVQLTATHLNVIPIFAFATLSLASHLAYAEEDKIVTDRPDFVESSDVVGKGRFQVETALEIERNRNAGIKERTTFTPTLLRVGISENWELRMETDGRTVNRSA